MLTGCQDKLLDGSELDMSKLGPNEKYVVAARIYENIETGEEYVKRKYEYDKYGNMIKQTSYNVKVYNSKEPKKLIKRWEYDKHGNMLKRVFTGWQYFYQEYSYNSQGQKIGYIKKDKNGETVEEAEFEYWQNGNLKHEKIEDFLGRRKEIFYNQQGDPKEGLIISTEGKKIELKYKIDYYPNGNKKKKVKEAVYNGETIKTEVSDYNKEGKKIEHIEKEGNTISYWCEQEYNKNGDLVKFISKDKNGRIKKYKEYKYDVNGNKIRYLEKRRIDNELTLTGWTESKFKKNKYELFTRFKKRNGDIFQVFKYKYKRIKVKE